MMTVVSVVVFMGAFAGAVGVIALSLAPQWHRIVRLAAGHVEQPFAPLAALAHAERRIAVRRWATASGTAPSWREAA